MPDAPLEVQVQLADRSYPIEIGSGNLSHVGSFIESRHQLTHALVITDSNVEHPHAARATEAIEATGARADLVVLAPGETTKSIGNADQLWRILLEFGADRKSVVVAVGGGVIGDLAGFVAATYARGIAFIQIPTSLLAQVDSSVGGKVGINLPGAKNMVGAFWQPKGVLIDTEVLGTLPIREYRAGLAEVVKYGVILDEAFFGYLEDNADGINERRADALRYVVARCCELKAEVVQADEREETGGRAVLNYGHTFCHALEAVTNYDLLHGEAVSIGMLCASRLAESLGRIDQDTTRRQHRLLARLGLLVDVPSVDRAELMTAMQRDKKVEHGQLRFVLPTRIGHVELVSNVPTEKALAAWDA